MTLIQIFAALKFYKTCKLLVSIYEGEYAVRYMHGIPKNQLNPIFQNSKIIRQILSQ